MKKYRVIVDGQEYEIGIEPLDASELKPAAREEAPKAQAAAPVRAATPASAGAETVFCPMPGNVLSVRVQKGSAVKKGQVLMILEAMKMENEIIAPRDGMIASVNVQAGMSVDTGAVLCSLQ